MRLPQRHYQLGDRTPLGIVVNRRVLNEEYVWYEMAPNTWWTRFCVWWRKRIGAAW